MNQSSDSCAHRSEGEIFENWRERDRRRAAHASLFSGGYIRRAGAIISMGSFAPMHIRERERDRSQGFLGFFRKFG